MAGGTTATIIGTMPRIMINIDLRSMPARPQRADDEFFLNKQDVDSWGWPPKAVEGTFMNPLLPSAAIPAQKVDVHSV